MDGDLHLLGIDEELHKKIVLPTLFLISACNASMSLTYDLSGIITMLQSIMTNKRLATIKNICNAFGKIFLVVFI